MTERPGTWSTLFPEGRGPGDGLRGFIEAAQESLIVDDVPEAVVDLFESDVLMVERLAEEVLPRVQAEGTGAADAGRWADEALT